MKLFKTLLLSSALVACVSSAYAYDQLYIFGDSLSDEGVQDNNPVLLVSGKAPTWTNPGGQVWPTDLALLLGMTAPTANNADFASTVDATHTNGYIKGIVDGAQYFKTGTDYAAGGATTSGIGFGANAEYSPPSLTQQIEFFLTENHGNVDPNGLYVVWAGANDVFAALESGVTSPTAITQVLTNALTNIAASVKALHQAGAKNIVVVDLPNLGLTPLFGNNLTESSAATAISYQFNSLANAILGSATLGFNVKSVDVYFLLTSIYNTIVTQNQPYTYQFNGVTHTVTNVTGTACNQGANAILGSALICGYGENADYHGNYFFTDGVHPTNEGSQLIALQIAAALNS